MFIIYFMIRLGRVKKIKRVVVYSTFEINRLNRIRNKLMRHELEHARNNNNITIQLLFNKLYT